MRLRLAASAAPLLALVLAACADGGGASGPGPRPPAEGDAALVVQVLDGALAPEEVLGRVSRSGGWPIPTSEGWLFVTLDQGLGPYLVRSPTGAFPDTALRSERGIAWGLVPIAEPRGAAYTFVTRFADAFVDGMSRHLDHALGVERMLVDAEPPGLVRYHGVGGEGMTPRTLRVWVPAEPPTHLLYVHDGQNLFRPGATTFGFWELQAAAGPRTLVVGIDNSSARKDEYSTGAVGEAYADAMETVVRPFIEARHGTPVRRGVMGASRGGLLAYLQAFRHPGVYDFVASLSGVMGKYDPSPPIIALYQGLPACPTGRFYLDTGGGPPGGACADADQDGFQDGVIADDFYCPNVQMRGVLEGLGCAARTTYVHAEGAPHNEGSWRARSPAILDLFEAL